MEGKEEESKQSRKKGGREGRLVVGKGKQEERLRNKDEAGLFV